MSEDGRGHAAGIYSDKQDFQMHPFRLIFVLQCESIQMDLFFMIGQQCQADLATWLSQQS
jgi:hypothetical protein